MSISIATKANLDKGRRLNVTILQPLIPHYRASAFERLASLPTINLTLVSDRRPTNSSLQAVSPPSSSFTSVSGPVRTVGPFRLQLSGLGQILRDPPDVLVLGWNTRYLDLLPTLLAARMRSVATVLWGHGSSKNDTRMRRQVRYWFGGMADVCLFYDHNSARTYIEASGNPERVFTAPNAIDQTPIRQACEAWTSRPSRLEAFQREQKIEPSQTVLFVSRLEKRKRVQDLLIAFASLHRSRPKARLVIIGGGPDEQSLRQMARTYSIGESTIFTGPIHDQTALAPWFLSSSALVVPSSLGLSVLHAFGFGLPVITSDDQQSHGPEFIALTPRKNGLLFRPNDPESLAAQIEWLWAHPAAREEMASGALSTVAEDGFSLASMVSAMERAILAAFALRHKTTSNALGMD